MADASAEFDRDVKLPFYAEHGISTAWLLDLEQGCLEIYDTPEGGEYADVRRPGRDEAVAVPPDGSVQIDVGELFL